MERVSTRRLFAEERLSKKDCIDRLKAVLIKEGHTKQRATVLAKEHYRRFSRGE